jgi:hypothetical protein
MFDQFPSIAMLPASDMEGAKGWYQEKLGLTPTEENEGGLTYQTGDQVRRVPKPVCGDQPGEGCGVRALRPSLREDRRARRRRDRAIPRVWLKDSQGNIITVVHQQA